LLLATPIMSMYCPFRSDNCFKECALLIRDGSIVRCAMTFTYDVVVHQNEIKQKLDTIIGLLQR
jgi:hypothetical protein